MNIGDTPSVLALSWGKGDPQKDAIALVYLDQFGRMREHTKLDNLVDAELREEFQDLVTRRKPDVIVLGGFSMATTKLSIRVKDIVYDRTLGEDGWSNGPNASDIPIVYLPDQVARIFQHSSRALEEFGSLPETTKYCIGLARMAQNPLNEYAALGEDIIAINFDDSSEDQALVNCACFRSMFSHHLPGSTRKAACSLREGSRRRSKQGWGRYKSCGC